jgi:CheY-like chemotaxis protein
MSPHKEDTIRILWLEDDDILARIFRQTLELLAPEELPIDGCTRVILVRVSNQAAAEIAAASESFDFIISDLRHPLVPNGELEAMDLKWISSRLRSLQPHAVFIIWSSFPYENNLITVVRAIRDHGVSDVIPKDLRLNNVLFRLREAWRSSHREEELPANRLTIEATSSCFLSYSSRDQLFAERLYADIRRRGIRCWFAPEDMRAGKKVHEQIEQAIGKYDKLLLIISEHSMQSEWVKTEIAHARAKEVKEHRRVLFPIAIVPFKQIREWTAFDADSGKDSAREIREYFIPDFSDWSNEQSYGKGLSRLLEDLHAD